MGGGYRHGDTAPYIYIYIYTYRIYHGPLKIVFYLLQDGCLCSDTAHTVCASADKLFNLKAQKPFTSTS